MTDITNAKWHSYWRWDEEKGEADCGIIAEPLVGHAHAICQCPRYMTEAQWREIAARICDDHNEKLGVT